MSENGDALAKRYTIAECVEQYRRAVADIREACARLTAAQEQLNVAFNGSAEYCRISLCRAGRFDFDAPDRALKSLESDIWRAIIERTEVRRMLSTSRAAELDRMLEENTMGELTVENVEAFVRGIHGQLPDLLEEAVAEVFDFLRPERSNYKTNSELELGDKVILSYMVSSDRFSERYDTLSDRAEARLTALENVFSSLDGQGQITRNYHSDISRAIRATPTKGDGRCETRYFAARCCKNGNLHITFKRPDLVARLNQIAGGARLKPAKTA